MSDDTIDLHTHTLYSDGSASPEELVAMAASAGARAIAITDHDTVDGLAEGRAAAERLGVEFVTGIEISAEHQPGTMHILGYYIDSESSLLQSKLVELKLARRERNPEIASRLRALGFDIDYDEVVETAGSEVVGRPHFARLMVKKGYAESIQDAFTRFLAKGAAAFVDKRRLSPADSINLIHSAGGVAVLAHPYQLKPLPVEGQDELIGELAAMGLDGVEAIYSRHSPEQREAYSEMAARHGLLLTGGSDFHGSYKPDIDIVRGLGDLRVPYSLLAELKSRALRRLESIVGASGDEAGPHSAE
ncbi:MAG TPA: PHP domain-containing protein [Blastocatellia bacterium]|nr:PHP domain-containing protein [Blastocatellia bacterium]